MTNMDVSQLVSCISYLKFYLGESLNHSNMLHKMNEEKDTRIADMQNKIETLENEIVTQNNQIIELKNDAENTSTQSDSEHNITRDVPSSEDLRKCQNEMIIILKERCDYLTEQLLATRRAWHEKCILIEKYRRELIDVSDQITGVHKKLGDMKDWQKKIESFYMTLKENQEHSQIAACEENHRINSEIIGLKRFQNELRMNDESKEIATMNGTGDNNGNDERKLLNQVTLDRSEILNRCEIFSKVVDFNQFDLMKSTTVINPISTGLQFFKNFDLFGTIKSKFGQAMLQLTGNDKKSKKESLIKYGVPATIMCCVVTGTLLTQLIFKCPTNKGFTIAQVGGPRGFLISAPLHR